MRRAELLAWGLAGLSIALLAASAVIDASGGTAAGEVLDHLLGVQFVPALAFPVVGAFVVRGTGGHVVGWLAIAIGVLIALHWAVAQWGHTAVVDDPGSLPGADLAGWYQMWGWLPGWILITTLLPVVFPEGHVTGRRRTLAVADAVAVATVVAVLAAASWPLRHLAYAEGTEGDPRFKAQFAAYAVGIAVIAVLTLLSLGSLVRRFRRAEGEARRQIAWVVYGAAIAVVASLVGTVVEASVVQVVESSALVGGFAVAMSRHRLYDIDVLVNRTLVYGALTATLAATYAGTVLLAQLVLDPLTGDSGLAVAVSTLLVAALFRPARARIQRGVDRRFYRRRYDARRTVEAFAARLRDDVDLDVLSAELRAVVGSTVQPAHVGLWLADPEERG